jgi:hypothetical protein
MNRNRPADATGRGNQLTARNELADRRCGTEHKGRTTVAARHVVAGLHGRAGHVPYLLPVQNTGHAAPLKIRPRYRAGQIMPWSADDASQPVGAENLCCLGRFGERLRSGPAPGGRRASLNLAVRAMSSARTA